EGDQLGLWPYRRPRPSQTLIPRGPAMAGPKRLRPPPWRTPDAVPRKPLSSASASIPAPSREHVDCVLPARPAPASPHLYLAETAVSMPQRALGLAEPLATKSWDDAPAARSR